MRMKYYWVCKKHDCSGYSENGCARCKQEQDAELNQLYFYTPYWFPKNIEDGCGFPIDTGVKLFPQENT